MSLKVSKRSVKQWRDVTVGEFDCPYELANLEKGEALTSEKFYCSGSTWCFSVKGSKEGTQVVWRFAAMLRCLSKGEGVRDFDSCEVAVGDVRLHPVAPDVPRGFCLYYYTAKVDERDLCEIYAEEGTVLFNLTITTTNPARFIVENTNLEYRKEATIKEKKRPVDERETGGQLEGDTGRVEGPPPQSETGGMKGDTGKAERPPPGSETDRLEGDTGKVERPAPESETDRLEGDTVQAERPAPESEAGAQPPRGNDAFIVLSRSISGEICGLFIYCAAMHHLFGEGDSFYYNYLILALLGVMFVWDQVSDVLQNGDRLTYLYVLVTVIGCAIIPPYFRAAYQEMMIDSDLIGCLAIIAWHLFLTEWKSTTTPDKGIQGTPDGRQ